MTHRKDNGAEGLTYLTIIKRDGTIITQGVDAQRELLRDFARCVGRQEFSWGDLPDVCTVTELAWVLGVHKNSIYSLIEDGELPGVIRIGRCIRIDKATLRGAIIEGV